MKVTVYFKDGSEKVYKNVLFIDTGLLNDDGRIIFELSMRIEDDFEKVNLSEVEAFDVANGMEWVKHRDKLLCPYCHTDIAGRWGPWKTKPGPRFCPHCGKEVT